MNQIHCVSVVTKHRFDCVADKLESNKCLALSAITFIKMKPAERY